MIEKWRHYFNVHLVTSTKTSCHNNSKSKQIIVYDGLYGHGNHLSRAGEQVNERTKTKRVQNIFSKPTHLQRKRPTAIPIHQTKNIHTLITTK